VARAGLAVLDRYLLRELVGPFALGTALFTFFLVIDRVYHLTDLVITKGVPFALVLQLLAYMLPSFLAHTLPMALLVSVLLACGRLAGDLEIIACKAAGISLLRLFRPVLLAALVVTALAASFTLYLTPVANAAFQRQLFTILRTRATTGITERVFNTTFGEVVLYVEEVSPSQIALRSLLVSDERDPKLSRIITAREGRLLTDETSRRITLRLLDGAVNEADVVPAQPPPTVRGADDLQGGAAGADRYRYARFAVYDMSLSVDSPLGAAPRVGKPEKDLDLAALSRTLVELRNDPAHRTPFALEWHKRLALPLAGLVFPLLGFPLAARSPRGGRSLALAVSLVIVVAYYVLLDALEGMATRGQVPVWLAIWGPNLLFGAAGLTLLLGTVRTWRWPRLRGAWRRLERAGRFRSRGVATPRWALGRLRRGAGPARDSTHLIDRYLVREHLGYILLGLAVAAAVYVVLDLLRTLDRYLRVKPPLLYIAEHFLYRLPVALHEGLPIVMLVATIFLFLSLARSHELTALKAAGVSLYRVSAPALGLGVAVVLSAGLFQELALPGLNQRGDEVDRVKIRGRLPRHLQTQERLWVRTSDTRFYRIELLSPGTKDLYGVTILEIDRSFRLQHRLDARRAHWTPAGWELSDGAIRRVEPDGQVRTVPFTRTTLDLEVGMEDLAQIQKPASSLSYVELREYIRRLEAAGFEVRKHLVELYAKLSFPLVNLAMVLVAIPLAIEAARGGRIIGVALAIGILAAYFTVHYIALAFARAELLPPLLAAWTANVIFLGAGTSLLLRART
jgi:lipopolysaccharide export system permease protein